MVFLLKKAKRVVVLNCRILYSVLAVHDPTIQIATRNKYVDKTKEE